MRKFVTSLVLVFLLVSNTFLLQAEELLPSEVYYNENIAVNIVGSAAPKLNNNNAGDEGLNPDGDGWGTGGFVGSPIGDSVLPIAAAVTLYASFLLYKRRTKA